MASPNTAPIYLFNCANEVSYTVQINGGDKVEVAATSSGANWVPGTSSSPAALLLDSGTSAPGSFNLGDNNVVVQTGRSAHEWTIDIPINPPGSIDAGQLYFFFKTYSQAPQWVFLADGQIVAGTATA